jgi:hypothetical protein
MNCPKCNSEMEMGWLAIYEPLPITRLVWQPVKPGWVRFRMPREAVRVIQPRAWGHGCPEGFICKTCKVTLFSYDDKNTT